MSNKNNSGQKGQRKVAPLSVIANIIGILLIVAVIALCMLSFVPKVTNHQVFNILTGSMEPEIPVGSMVIVSEVDPQSLETGDIITFERVTQGDVVTHRVAKNDASQQQIITKGDANAQVDMDPVPYSNVIGKVSVHMPVVGVLLGFMSTIAGKIAYLCIAIAGFLLTVLAGVLRE